MATLTAAASARTSARWNYTLGEQRSWYAYDWACSAFSTTVVSLLLGPYLTDVARNVAVTGAGSVGFLWFTLRPEAYFPACVTLSVLLQLVLLPIVGALADRSGHKKWHLASYAYLGAAATMGLYAVQGTRLQLGGLLFVAANLAFGAALVVYDSYLPQICAPHDRDRVSSRGWAMGYLGGTVLLAANLGLLAAHGSFGMSTADAVRICLVSAGAWWALFTLVPLVGLRDRPPVHLVPDGGSPLASGFRQLAVTMREAAGYRMTLLFMLAYLLYNDGIQTMIAYSGTFGAEELGIDEQTLALMVLLVSVVAFAGALWLGTLARRYGAQRTVLCSLGVWAGVVGVAYFMPSDAVGLFLALAAVIGLVLGGTQALSRSLFSHLIPGGRQAEYFALYEVSSRGTTLVGSLMFTVMLQLTGSYRSSMLALLGFFVLGFAVLARVDFRVGATAVGNPPPARV